MAARAAPVVLTVLACGILAAPPAAAEIWRVPADAPTIEAGLDSAAAGDVVEVSCGTYFESGLLLGHGVILRGETADPDCVVIDAQQADVVISAFGLDETAVIEGITLRSGLGPEGGGMHCEESLLRISRCAFVDNRSQGPGGGLWCTGGGPDILECRFVGNEAYFGATVTGGGGGAAFSGSYPSLTGCWFEENIGGGVWCEGGHAILLGCTFTGNSSNLGGGLQLDSGLATLAGCTLADNFVVPGCLGEPGAGAGIACSGTGSMLLAGCIIASSSEGEAVWCQGGGQVYLQCCDVYGNAGGDWVGCIAGQAGQAENFSANPAFCRGWNPDFPYGLFENSPCAAENNLLCGTIGAWPVECYGPTAVDRADPAPPLAIGHRCHPNPFNPGTTISFTLPAALPVEVSVLGADGRRVAILLRDRLEAGRHEVSWDGRDTAGRPAASGVYLYRIEAGGLRAAGGMLLIK